MLALELLCRFTLEAVNQQANEPQTFKDYDAVVIACPLESCGLDLSSLQVHAFLPVHLRQYKHMVVTLVRGVMKPGNHSRFCCSCCRLRCAVVESLLVFEMVLR